MLEIWYNDLDSDLEEYRKLSFIFQNPADPKVQFDASTKSEG
jgi:hypothetical protein